MEGEPMVALGMLFILLAVLGASYFHMFVWHPRHPGKVWPWQVWSGFGGGVLAGIGLIAGSWALTGMGAAVWLLGRLVRYDPIAD
jgi:protein-S-isoprenylcysteine O-methyltransferase Ste14